MHISTISLLALALVAPFALAQGTASFEDAALDAMPPLANAYADVTSASVALADADTLQLTMTFTALPEMTPGMVYLFLVTDGEAEWFAGAVTAPDLEWLYGPWVSDEEGGSDTKGTDGSFTTGAGGSISVLLPLDAMPGVASLTGGRILVGDIKSGAADMELPVPPIIPIDEAQGAIDLRVRSAPAEAPTPDATAPASEAAPTGASAPSEASAPPAATPAEDARVPLAPLAALAALAVAATAARRSR